MSCLFLQTLWGSKKTSFLDLFFRLSENPPRVSAAWAILLGLPALMHVGTALAHIIIQEYYFRLGADGKSMRGGENTDDDRQIAQCY